MPLDHIPPEVAQDAPGLVGALLALRWVVGPLLHKVTAVGGGVAMAHFVSGPASAYFGTGEGLMGFTIGMFGMTVADKLVGAFSHVDLAGVINDAMRRWLGTQPKE